MIRWITDRLGTGAYTRVYGSTAATLVDVRDLLDRLGNAEHLLKLKVDEVAGHLRLGRTVVVCCDYGMSRSNAVAAGALSLVEGIDFQTALGRVRDRTGEHSINIDVIAAVRQVIQPGTARGATAGKVLVTGGSGFLGIGLAATDTPGSLLMPSREQLDVRRSAADLDDFIVHHGVCKVVHLAAPRIYSTNEALGDILVMLKNILDVCLRHSLPLVTLSSWTVYSGHKHGPILADEKLALLPDGSYGHARALAEDLINRFRRGHRLDCTLLRSSPILGYGNHQPRFIYRFIDLARRGDPIVTHVYKNGEPHLDLIWQEDVVGALQAAIKGSHSGDFNLGSGVGVSTRQVAEFIKHELASSSPLETVAMADDAPNVVMDSGQAAKVLGFRSLVGWQEGVRRVIDETLRQVQQ